MLLAKTNWNMGAQVDAHQRPYPFILQMDMVRKICYRGPTPELKGK